MGTVIAICTSDARGTQKQPRQSAHFVVDWGIQGDAHGGSWHRQVSLLSADKIAAFNEKGAGVKPGAFGENLVVEGIDFRALPVGALLRCGQVLLETLRAAIYGKPQALCFDRADDITEQLAMSQIGG